MKYKYILGLSGLVLVVASLSACCNEPLPVSTPVAVAPPAPVIVKNNQAHPCYVIKNKMRNLDRSTPDATAKLNALEKQLEALNCGVK